VDFFTEYKRDKTTLRAHPNYRGNGLWYDWAMVEYAPLDLDLNRATSVTQEIESAYPPGSYPAKILAFSRSKEGTIMAIIHTCESKEHSSDDSCLTEQWYMEYKQCTINAYDPRSDTTKRKLVRKPVLRIVEADTLRDRVYVVEDSPGLRESLSSKEETSLVVLVKDRKQYWPKYFTSTVNRANCCPISKSS
jgi:hypothetical protein